MSKTSTLKPFSYSYKKNNLESNTCFRKKNPVISPDKIYFFRTSLFTEKSKNYIQKLHSCEKNKSNLNSTILANEIVTPKVSSTLNQPNKTSIKLKKGKFMIFQNKSINKSDIEQNLNSITKEKSDFTRNTIINKSSNDIITHKIVTNKTNIENETKNITVDKKESNYSQDKPKKVNIAIKNLKKMKKEKIYTPLNNILNANDNKKTILVNYINQNHSLLNLANAKSGQKQILTKDKSQKIETVHKIRYRLKSQKSSNKNKGKESRNIISFGGIYNQHLHKGLKNLKALNNHYNMKSSSMFDENFYFSRYKLGNYLAKKNNNRYGSITTKFNANTNKNAKNSMATDEKISTRRKSRNSLYKKNIYN